MKKICLILSLFCVLVLAAQQQQQRRIPKTVQGIDYAQTLPNSGQRILSNSDYPEDPGDLVTPEGDFTFDDIESWAGEGAKRAALVIQWNDSRETGALVFGYRWDGEATGADMLRAVAAANPQLYALVQYTNVSSPTDPNGGYTINGIGWDLDGDGDISLIDTGKGNTVYTSEDGVFIHPRGYVPGSGGSSDYDYDNWKAGDKDDLWQAGWYSNGYWSYWVKGSQESNFGYSSWGASGRVLTDGCWDGWNFSINFGSYNWLGFKPAPAPIPEGAKTEFKNNGIYYKIQNYNKKTVTLCAPFEMAGETLTAYDDDITVPPTFTDGTETYQVVAIDKGAFKGSKVTSVTLPASVTKIGVEAFKDSELSELTLADADAITSIGAGAFENCSKLTEAFFPASMTSVPARLYNGTAVSTITIPATVEELGDSCFAANTKLTTVTIPASVTKFGGGIFAGCDAISSVTTESTKPTSIPDDTFSAAAQANATLRVPDGFAETYKTLGGWNGFSKFENFLVDVHENDCFVMGGVSYMITRLSDELNTVRVMYMPVAGNSDEKAIRAANAAYAGDIRIAGEITYQQKKFKVTEVADNAFYYAEGITGIELPEGITTLGGKMFSNCTNLKSVKLPSTLTTLGEYTFAYCPALDSIALPNNISKAGQRTFFQCKALRKVNIPASLTALPNNMFSYCQSLESIEIPSTVTTLGTTLFQNCTKLTDVKLPEGITVLPASTFSSCKALRTLDIPSTVTEIGSSCFDGCTALDIKVPATIKKIGTYAFQKTGIKSLEIPASITSLPNYLVQSCDSLTSVTMSANVTTLGDGMFKDCKNLKEIKFYGQTSESIPGTLHIPDGVTNIPRNCFNGCNSLTHITLPAGLKVINVSSFENMSGLTEIELPEGLTTVYGSAFRSTGISQLVFPASMTTIDGGYILTNSKHDETIYMCSPNPIRIYTMSFCTRNSSTYADIVVPTGSAEAYKTHSSWKSRYASKITEPTVKGIEINGKAKSYESEENDGKYTLRIPFCFAYDKGNLPAQFAKANDSIVARGYTYTLTFAPQGAEEPASAREAAGSLTATCSVEGNMLVAKGLTLDKDATYAGTVSASNGTGSLPASLPDMNLQFTAPQPMEFNMESYDAHLGEQFTVELIYNDETLKSKRLNWTSSDNSIATVYSGRITVQKKEGTATITAALRDDPTVKATMIVNASLKTPVSDITLPGMSDIIRMKRLDILGLLPQVSPADADVKTYGITISDPTIATTYDVRLFGVDPNSYSSKMTELVTHKSGTFTLTFTADDPQHYSKTYTVIVEDYPAEAQADEYQDGTFWLNEDWFGHTNGSINYITKDGEVIYRAYGSRNNYESFGCTSQYATIADGKLVVMSKQATDGGDPNKGGGRVVVADAKTMKKLASFDNISESNKADGRACAWAGHDKFYLGCTDGIRVLYSSSLTYGPMVEGIEGGSQYANQIGDMTLAGNYIFAIQQDKGIYAIDTETDKVVKKFGLSETAENTWVWKPQAITQTADGNVWAAVQMTEDNTKVNKFICIDPETLEIVREETLPSHLAVTCSWGSWRSANFQGAKKQNALMFGAGVESSIVSGNTAYYIWDLESDLSSLQPVWVFPKDMIGYNEKNKQAPYATVRWDERTNELLVCGTHGASGMYRYEWLHFIDCKSGSIARTIRLKDYYWFPAMPLFPDKHEVTCRLGFIDILNNGETVIDFNEHLDDPDGNNFNIKLSLTPSAAAAGESKSRRESADLQSLADVTISGKKVTIRPKENKSGVAFLNLAAESNGRATAISIPVGVGVPTGIENFEASAASVHSEGNMLVARGLDGAELNVYDMSGQCVAVYQVNGDYCRIITGLPGGIYAVRSTDGRISLKTTLNY